MKILSIRLKNINSLRGEHRVDFDRSPFREAGLFGIVGAMGSGKSTLLDCITLALYNRVPRYGQVSKPLLEKGNVILTNPEKDCFAEVRYESREGIFTARWSVAKTRNGTFRNVEMAVFDEAGQMVDSGLSLAPERNALNIGLDYEQFVRSILLCQGDFAKFLKSDRNERAKLLEKITGTGSFRKIGKRAFLAYNTRKREIDVLTETIDAFSRSRLSPQEREAVLEAVRSASEASATLAREMDAAKLDLQRKKRIEGLSHDLEQKQGALQIAENAMDDFRKEYAERLANYDRLFPFREDMANHQRVAARRDEWSGKIAEADKELGVLEKNITEAVGELGQWVKASVKDTDYLRQLDDLRDRMMEAEAERKRLQADRDGSRSRLLDILQKDMFSAERGLFDPEGGNTALLDVINARIPALADEFELKIAGFDAARLTEERDLLVRMAESLTLLQSGVQSYGQVKTRIGEMELKQEQLKQALVKREPEISRMTTELQALEKKLSDTEKEKAQLVAAENLEALRSNLVDGEPCPLCGSEHHPYAHDFVRDLYSVSDTLRELKQQVEKDRSILQSTIVDQRADERASEDLRKERESAEVELKRHSEDIENTKAGLGIERIQHTATITTLLKENHEKLARANWCIQYRNEEPQWRQLRAELSNFDDSSRALGSALSGLKAIYPGDDFHQAYSHRKDVMSRYLGQRDSFRAIRQQAAAELGKCQAELSQLQSSLEVQLQQAGYGSIAEARDLLISEAIQKGLAQKEQELKQDLATGKTAISELQKMLDREKQGDDGSVGVARQQEILDMLEMRISDLGAELDKNRTLLGKDDRIMEDIRTKEEDKKRLLDQLRPWEMLNKLIGDANGNRFNTMAQELTLQHLLLLANRRMQSLHSRYTLLLPEDLKDDDLRVSDAFKGGEVRTVRSLSGGETFVLSLALALALSDLASRNIRIDSLFVDEGFGSLDPETLDEAMSTLEQLQSESNKMVGIISHVESLKDRIFTQIRLAKGNSGFSTLSIYPEADSRDEAE